MASPDPATWVDDFGDYLYRFALGRVRNPALAQDLVQDTFLAAIRGLGNFGGKSTVRTWLTGILKNKIMDHYRRSGRVELINDLAALKQNQDQQFDEDGHWLVDTPLAPRDWNKDLCDHMDRDRFWAVFRECSDKLPEQTRKVFVLREVDDEPAEHICEALGISPQNFWTIMHRARAALRRCLETNYFAPAG